MKKLLIKIIKRQAVEALKRQAIAAGDKLQNSPSGSAPLTAEMLEKTARHRQREYAAVISKWIPERRRNRQAEVADAVRRLFGDDILPVE